jgi:SAM-dependent methyltransferase
VRLGALKRHWERLGRRDPFWAVLTDPSKRGGGWDREEFFRGGAKEIAAALWRAEQLGLRLSRRRALDFGCGVGRITQALADHFERCDGVDISTSMLEAARLHNRHPGRCTYHLNTAPDLRLFDAASFSFVYSTLVLQHMEPQYSQAYIRELLRVLAPGGLLVFQLPSHRAAQEPSADAARTEIVGRLPNIAFSARLAIDASALSLRASQEVTLKVTVENCSRHAWAALPDARGRYQINLANRWLDHNGELLQRDDARCPLPHDVSPGSRAELMLGINAPRFDGAYSLELDLVQENVCWFGERGSQTLRVPCRVTGGLPHVPRPSAPKVVAVANVARFRERHPRMFDVLRATGLRDAYWAWRRALDGVKGRRDRLIVSLKEHAFDPVVPPLVNWWKRRPFAPRMEMYCVPRAKVTAILAENGGRLVGTEEELMPGGFQSCRYWVVKK